MNIIVSEVVELLVDIQTGLEEHKTWQALNENLEQVRYDLESDDVSEEMLEQLAVLLLSSIQQTSPLAEDFADRITALQSGKTLTGIDLEEEEERRDLKNKMRDFDKVVKEKTESQPSS